MKNVKTALSMLGYALGVGAICYWATRDWEMTIMGAVAGALAPLMQRGIDRLEKRGKPRRDARAPDERRG